MKYLLTKIWLIIIKKYKEFLKSKSKNMSFISRVKYNFTPWEQKDWSVIDVHWNRISFEDRLKIIEKADALTVSQRINDILNYSSISPVVILDAKTWSWKSTQVPQQFLLSNPWKNIVVTQPRVISATSIADRTSKELLAKYWDPRFSIWRDVWYRTWRILSSKHTSSLSFHTDWLEMMRQLWSWIFPDIMFLDEIHWFSIPTEIVAHTTREHMLKNKWATRLILMSATLDPVILQEYFKEISSDIPVITIPWRNHKINEHFLPWEDPIKLITSLYQSWKNTLYFVPWKRDISNAIKALKEVLWEDSLIFWLHSEISKWYQDFIINQTPEPWKPIIVIATNVAQEAVTIPYIDAVVDSWEEKTVFTDENWISTLIKQPVSKIDSRQRAWRWWRTHEWEYYYVSETSFDDLVETPITPIEKEMLDREILLLSSKWKRLREIYKDFIHLPNKDLLDIAYNKLKLIWAIDENWDITELWIELIQFPLSVYNSAILHEAIRLWCTEYVVWVVAILEKKPFLSKSEKWKGLNFWWMNDGDLFFYVNLFKKLTARKLSAEDLKNFEWAWVSKDEIDEYVRLDWSKMFFEVIPSLAKLWIKRKMIYEIYNLIETLQIRLSWFWVNLSESTFNETNIRNSIVAWSLYNVFVYNKWRGCFTNTTNYEWYCFKPWNISVTPLRNWQHYTWVPFCIAWNWDNPDIDLLLNLTPVPENTSHDKIQTLWFNTDEFLEMFWEVPLNTQWNLFTEKLIKKSEKTTKTTYKPTKQDLDRIWLDSTWTKSSVIWIETEEKSRHYLAKNWLPTYLIEFNEFIKKFIDEKIKSWIEFDIEEFRILLWKVTVDLAYRIDPDNIEKTKKSFRDDTYVLQMFLESRDPWIVAFLSWNNKYKDVSRSQWVLWLTLRKEDWTILIDNKIDESENSNTWELRRMKEEYFSLLSFFNKNWKDLEWYFSIKKQKRLEKLISEIIPLASDKPIFLSIWLSREELLKFISSLKWLNRLKDSHKKLESKRNHIWSFLDRFDLFIWWNLSLEWSLNIESILKSKSEINRFNKWIWLFLSDDKRKKKRWERILIDLRNKISYLLFKNQNEIDNIVHRINFWDNLLLKNFYNYCVKFLSESFEKQYFDIVISWRIPNFMRKVITSILNWSVEEFIDLFKEFILWFDFAYLKDNKWFENISEISEIFDIVENKFVSNSVFIEESWSTEIIWTFLWELRILKEKFLKFKQEVTN